MVFSSQLFLFAFLPAALLLYHAARRGPRWLAHGLLAAASYVFYGWANPPFALLLLASTLVDYACGRVIARAQPGREPPPRGVELPLCPPGGPRSRAQRAALVVSVATNLSLLGFFKYANLALDGWAGLMEALGLAHLAWRDFLRVTLPLGISFYTFQSMSYTIDVYRGHARATRSLVDFACYVSLFSQLVAGPILRFSEVATQLLRREHDAARLARGAALFCLGLAKKVLVANPVGKVADTCFEAGSLHVLDAWVGLAAYSFQIYFDFSGYSDMAIGLGLLLGFVFPRNFDAPYRSRSLTEFWRRWHISLSSWLRDYLYLPLGGNRRGAGRTYANLLVVMLLGGLWHGASANFLLWGGAHGLLLALERARGRRSPWGRLPAPLRTLATFGVVSLLWVPFRAPDLAATGRYLAHLVGARAPEPAAALVSGVIYQPGALLCLALAAGLTWGAPQAWDWTQRLSVPKALAALALFWLCAALLTTQAYNPFIYFIF